MYHLTVFQKQCTSVEKYALVRCNKNCTKTFFVSSFLVIFWNEITTILTPSTSEGGDWGGRILEVSDYESAMVIIDIKLQDLKSVIG